MHQQSQNQERCNLRGLGHSHSVLLAAAEAATATADAAVFNYEAVILAAAAGHLSSHHCVKDFVQLCIDRRIIQYRVQMLKGRT